MKKYKWRAGSRIAGLDPQVVGEHLDRIAVDGRLTAQQVLDDARSPKSPTHAYFEWDDTTAAAEHRLWQARQLIACVVTIRSELSDPHLVREYIAINTPQERAYVNTSVALGDKELRASTLAQAERDFQTWRDKYETLVELAEVFSVAERVFAAQREER